MVYLPTIKLHHSTKLQVNFNRIQYFTLRANSTLRDSRYLRGNPTLRDSRYLRGNHGGMIVMPQNPVFYPQAQGQPAMPQNAMSYPQGQPQQPQVVFFPVSGSKP